MISKMFTAMVFGSAMIASSLACAMPRVTIDQPNLIQNAAVSVPQIKIDQEGLVQKTAANCSAAAQTIVAQQNGAQLLSATADTQNGKAVCKITVLVKGSSGQRPKKITVTVPQ